MGTAWHKWCLLAAFPLGSVLKKNKRAVSKSAKSMASIQGRLQELLDEGRSLRRQIEAISNDVDFPLTRESDGDPRLRTNASRPDPIGRRKRSL